MKVKETDEQMDKHRHKDEQQIVKESRYHI